MELFVGQRYIKSIEVLANYWAVLRVMPSDNSCLFTAFGGALPQQVLPWKLRQMMAVYIQQHLDVYSEAILGVSPEQYCRSIIDPDRWGGGIELSILSSIFDIRICTFDVEARFPPSRKRKKKNLTDRRRRTLFHLEKENVSSAFLYILASTTTE